MDEMKRKESGASEVIGAVLLVCLVVIGGAVIAAFVFGQPTPKEVPHVSFGVSLDSEHDLLTLHHTGGDTLLNGTYGVIIDGVPVVVEDRIPEEYRNWSVDRPLPISDVDQFYGSVVLTYLDDAGGETVLRKVDFADPSSGNPVSPQAPWTISGYKFNVTSSGQQVGPLGGVRIRLVKIKGDFDFPAEGNVTLTDETGYYSFVVPVHEATYSLAEEDINTTLWAPYSPATGRYEVITLNHHQTSQVRNFSNERLPPPPMRISGHKYNVTWKGENPQPLEGVVINLTLTSGDAPGFPVQGKTATTDADGYYEFEVPGWWDFEVPAVLPTYRLTEEIDRAVWKPFCPSSGVIENVVPAATDQDFSNWKIVPNKKISGFKWGYYSNTPWLMGPVPGIRIDLTRTSGDTPDTMQSGQTNTTTTNSSGYYEFVVSGMPAYYTLTERPNQTEWRFYDPSTGSFENVPPGATRDFKNWRVVPPPMGGRVIRLEKTEQINTTTEGYVVGGTYLQIEVRSGDHVSFGTNAYTFPRNNEVFRFVLNGDQYRGRLTITKGPTELIEFSFNATLQHQVNGVWTAVPGCSGPITDIHITNLNKNTATADSTLSYMHPSYMSWTMLRLDGQTVIPSIVNDTPFEFTNLHVVHDNSEHEGNNIMWIWLESGNNSLLVEGDYVYL